MAHLIPCAACGHTISNAAVACPSCGHPINTPSVNVTLVRPKKQGSLLLALVIVGAIFAIPAMCFSARSPVVGGIIRPAPEDRTFAPTAPQRILADGTTLREGRRREYSFTLSRSCSVEVAVMASPIPVNVTLLSEAQWPQYQQSVTTGGGGSYLYTTSLSSRSVTSYVNAAVLSAGRWYLVVDRPFESGTERSETNLTVGIQARQ
jgi:hypothetical protein